MTGREALLDPTGMDASTANTTLAPRPASLRGLRLALLDNTKPNGTILLEEIAQRLQDRYGAGEAVMYTKDYFGTPVKPALLARIVDECDVVITAVGDCGSCSAATVADGILFERAGVPAVSICSDSFYMSGRAMAEVQGFAGFEFYAVEHPVASLSLEQIRERAEKALPAVLGILGQQV